MPASYPSDWKEIAARIKSAAGWICERCKHPHDVASGHVLTVHHLDGKKHNCADWNLAALCQRCHLQIQGRVKMDQMFFEEILDVSEWFKPHLQGFINSRAPNTAPPTCCASFEDRCAEHDRLTAENAPPINPQGKPYWMHPDFDRCSNDWWRLGLCDHCRADGGCDAHARKQFPTLFPDNDKDLARRALDSE